MNHPRYHLVAGVVGARSWARATTTRCEDLVVMGYRYVRVSTATAMRSYPERHGGGSVGFMSIDTGLPVPVALGGISGYPLRHFHTGSTKS
jgi:hypothetical protein